MLYLEIDTKGVAKQSMLAIMHTNIKACEQGGHNHSIEDFAFVKEEKTLTHVNSGGGPGMWPTKAWLGDVDVCCLLHRTAMKIKPAMRLFLTNTHSLGE